VNGYQIYSKIVPKLHAKYHSLLAKKLKDADIPLPIGGKNGSTKAWAEFMRANPCAQRKAFDAVLEAARELDAQYGTEITQDVWRNIIAANFKPYP